MWSKMVYWMEFGADHMHARGSRVVISIRGI